MPACHDGAALLSNPTDNSLVDQFWTKKKEKKISVCSL